MDLTLTHPEGLTPILTDWEIDQMEDYYNKDIDQITSKEKEDFLSLSYEDYL